MEKKFKRQIFLVKIPFDLAKKIRRGFEKYNAKIFVVEKLEALLSIAEQERLDALVLGAEAINDIPYIKQIRQMDTFAPIIFMCNNEEQMQYVIEADDTFSVLKSNVAIKELNAHINNQKNQQIDKAVFTIGKYNFNYKNRLLSIDNFAGQSLFQTLTKKEAGILLLLAKRMNHTVLRNKILNTLWYSISYNYSRSMDVYISFLRKYLSLDKNVSIKNIHSRGFMLKCL